MVSIVTCPPETGPRITGVLRLAASDVRLVAAQLLLRPLQVAVQGGEPPLLHHPLRTRQAVEGVAGVLDPVLPPPDVRPQVVDGPGPVAPGRRGLPPGLLRRGRRGREEAPVDSAAYLPEHGVAPRSALGDGSVRGRTARDGRPG